MEAACNGLPPALARMPLGTSRFCHLSMHARFVVFSIGPAWASREPGKKLTLHPSQTAIVHVDWHRTVLEGVASHCVLSTATYEHAVVNRLEQIVLNQPASLHVVLQRHGRINDECDELERAEHQILFL